LIAIVLVPLLCHAFRHPTKKQTTDLYVPLETGVGVEDKMFHLRSLGEGNRFPAFAEFLGIVHRVVLPLRRNANPLEGVTILRKRVG